jgi:hypothetical protein
VLLGFWYIFFTCYPYMLADLSRTAHAIFFNVKSWTCCLQEEDDKGNKNNEIIKKIWKGDKILSHSIYYNIHVVDINHSRKGENHTSVWDLGTWRNGWCGLMLICSCKLGSSQDRAPPFFCDFFFCFVCLEWKNTVKVLTIKSHQSSSI